MFGNIDVRQVESAMDGNERIAEASVVGRRSNRRRNEFVGESLSPTGSNWPSSVPRRKSKVQQQVVARLEAGSRLEEIAKARADLLAAQATVRDAEMTYNRDMALLKSDAVTQQDVDDAKAAFESAKAHEEAVKATLDLVLAGPRKEDIAEAKALLGRYEAELAEAEHDLRDASSTHRPMASSKIAF